MEPARILIVDDEAPIVDLVCAYLKQEGFQLAVAANDRVALMEAQRFRPDLVVLDVLLPDLDGLEVCRRLHQQMPVGILMVSARAEEVDRLMGLGAGADDYLTKPFSPRELVARVKAILRREPPGSVTCNSQPPNSPNTAYNQPVPHLRRVPSPADNDRGRPVCIPRLGFSRCSPSCSLEQS